MKWTYEDLKAFTAARSVDLYKDVKPQDVEALPEAAKALWKLGWEISAQGYEARCSDAEAKTGGGK